MNKTIGEAERFVADMLDASSQSDHVDLLIFPSFMAMPAVVSALADSAVHVGAQDLFWEAGEGAFTGEVSGAMIKDAGATHVLIGHSERRHVIGESNEIVAGKLRAAVQSNLVPVLCVGETLDERQRGDAETVVSSQLSMALDGLGADTAAVMVIAYEPVWAIGTGQSATRADAVAMHEFIRSELERLFTGEVAQTIRIQYGGSVKPDNATELLGSDQIDGALIGGASLAPESFLAIAAGAPR